MLSTRTKERDFRYLKTDPAPEREFRSRVINMDGITIFDCGNLDILFRRLGPDTRLKMRGCEPPPFSHRAVRILLSLRVFFFQPFC